MISPLQNFGAFIPSRSQAVIEKALSHDGQSVFDDHVIQRKWDRFAARDVPATHRVTAIGWTFLTTIGRGDAV